MSDPEPIEPDEVIPTPSTGLAVAAPPSALAAAAEAALALPGAPGHDEFWALAAQAKLLAMSGAAPKAVRNDPHLALHLALVGRDLGISPSASLELIDVIKVRDGEYRLSLSPQLMNGQLRRLGLGMILPAVRTAFECVAVAFGPGGPDKRCIRTGLVAHVDDCSCDVLGTSEFTWPDAQMAGLAGAECQPGQHVMVTRTRGNQSWKACGCNQGYVTYPKRMLWWRASGFAGDDYFPEAGLGLYSPEALGSAVDEQGRALDVDSMELPPGFEPAAVGPGRQQNGNGAPAAEARADAADLWTLQERLHALPEGHKADLRASWSGEDSRLATHRPHDMPKSKLTVAKAMVTAYWGKARAAGIDMDQQLDELRQLLAENITAVFGPYPPPVTAPEAAPEAPEPDPAPEPPAEPAEADSEPQGAADDGPDKAHWLAVMRDVAEEVKQAAQGVPDNVVERIGADVKKIHHAVVNNELAEAELIGEFPPDSPIDLRRMVVCLLRLRAFRAAGVVPGGDG